MGDKKSGGGGAKKHKGDGKKPYESNAEKKRRRKHHNKLKRSNINKKYKKQKEAAEAVLMRSRSEATTKLLDGLDSAEWDVINDSFGGFAKSSGNNNNVNTRKEPFPQKFCRWFELLSLTATALMGILCFAYFGFRYQPPFEVGLCVCAFAHVVC